MFQTFKIIETFHWNDNPDHSRSGSLFSHGNLLDRLLFLDLRFPSEFFQLLAHRWDGVQWRERRGWKSWAFFKRSFSLDKSWHGGNFLCIEFFHTDDWNPLLDQCLWCFLYLCRFCFLPVTIWKAWSMARGERRACVLSVKEMGHHALIQLPFGKECLRGNRLSTPSHSS